MIRRLLNLPAWQLSILSGLLVGISYPPLKLGLVSWVALVPWLMAMDRSTPKRCTALGYLAGSVANGCALYWLALNSGGPFAVVFASLVGAVIYLALGWAVAGFLFSFLQTRTGKGFLLFPFVWVSIEYIMSFGPLGFPWASMSTPQAEYVPVIQLAEYTGIYGISFWAVWLNVLVVRILGAPRLLRPRLMAVAVTVLVIPWLYGYLKLATLRRPGPDDPSLVVAAVQPNVGPHDKWNPTRRDWIFDLLDSLFVVAARENPDLIVWPESATPAYLRTSPGRLGSVLKRVKSTGIPLLTGTVDWDIVDGKRRAYNGVLYITPDENLATYHKIHLVPLAEYNPLSDRLPVSEALSLGNFTPGSSITLFRIDGIPFSSVICYESAFPQLVRKFVKKGARFLVVVVNDGWFGNSSEPYQHAALARFRAVEHRMPVVRCANTGISAVFEPSGFQTTRLPVHAEGFILGGIFPADGNSFYTRFGDLFAVSCVGLMVILGAWFWHRER